MSARATPIVAFALLALVLGLTGRAAALDPIASVSDSLPLNRTAVDWVVALEINPTGISGGAAVAVAGLQLMLRDAAASIWRGSTYTVRNRIGFVLNSNLNTNPTLGTYCLPPTDDQAAVENWIAALNLNGNGGVYAPNYANALSAVNTLHFASGVVARPNTRVSTLITNGAPNAATANADGLAMARALKYKGVTVTTVVLNDLLVSPPVVVHDVERLSTQRSASANFNVRVDGAGLVPPYYNYAQALPLLLRRVRNDPGAMCTVFGDPHVITFDSNYFSFQGLGEFWLATSVEPTAPYLAVEARLAVCANVFGGAVLEPETAQIQVPRTTCVRDLAIADGFDVFNFLSQATASPAPLLGTSNAATVAVTVLYNNQTLPMTLFANTYTLQSGASLRMRTRSDRVVATLTLTGGAQFEMQFAPYGAQISIIPAVRTYNGLGGLCGLWDGLTWNDFTDASNVTYATGSASSDLAAFAESWRVRQDYSIFMPAPTAGQSGQRRVTDQAFPITWAGDYSMPSSLPDACGAPLPVRTNALYASAQTFFSDACAFDAYMGGDGHAALHAFRSHCHYYCAFGHMPSALVNASDCAGECVFDDPAFTKLDLHTRYSNSLLPAVQISGTDQPKILFAPDQHFGGQFDLQLAVTDLCGTQYQNVSVNVVCLNPPVVSASVGGDVPILSNVYGWPETFLVGSASSALPLVYSWKWMQTPLNIITLQNVSAPQLFPNSRSPTVFFQPQYAGQYVIEFAVNDGCAIVRYNLTFDVLCGVCAPSPLIAPVQPVLWNGASFGPVPSGGAVNVIGHFSQDFDRGILPQANLPRYQWAMGQQPNVLITTNSQTNTQWTVTLSTSPAPYTGIDTVITETKVGPYFQYSVPHTPLPVNPVEALYDVSDSWTIANWVTTWTNTTTVQTPTPQPFCQFTLNNYNSLDATVTVSPVLGQGPLPCLGVYNLTLTGQDECSSTLDAVPLDVSCSRPVPRIKCHTGQATYNWQTMSFPQLSFDGRDSYDTNADNSGQYATYSITDNLQWTAMSPLLCGDGVQSCSLGTAVTASVTPKRGNAQAAVQLSATNGCATNADTIILTLFCNGAVTAKTDQPYYTFTYAPPSQPTTGGAVSGILSTLPSPGVFQGWKWTVIDSSSQYPTDSTFVAPNFANPLVMNTTFANGYSRSGSSGGQTVYTASLVADGGCATASYQFTITMVCPNVITIQMKGTGPQGLTYAFTWVDAPGATGSFQAITLDASLTSGSIANNNPLQFHWQYLNPNTQPQPNMPISNPSVSITQVGPVTAPGTYTIQLAAHDACVWNWASAVITAQCPPPVPPTAWTVVTEQHANPYDAFVELFSFTGIDVNLAFVWSRDPNAPPPAGSSFLATPVAQQNFTFSPDRAGFYAAIVTVTNGCWTASARVTFRISCIQYSVIIPGDLQNQIVQFTDQQTVTLSGDGSFWPAWLVQGNFAWVWSVTMAPDASVYRIWNYTLVTVNSTVTTSLPVPGPVNTTVTITNVTTWNTTNWQRAVTLLPLPPAPGANPQRTWSTCFRPDVGGVYTVQLRVYPIGADDCPVVAQASVTNNCSAPPVVNIANLNGTQQFSRSAATHITLDASLSYSPNRSPLWFWWRQIDGPTPVGGVIHNANTSLASFVASLSEEYYTFLLIVSDGCQNVTTIHRVYAQCSTSLPVSNSSLYSWYDGEIPVTYMALGYDYSATLDQTVGAAHCQKYQWSVVGYSEQPQPYVPPSGPSTPVTKTAGFIAGMTIACLVIAGVGGYFGYKKWQQSKAGAAANDNGRNSPRVGHQPLAAQPEPGAAGSYVPPEPVPAAQPQPQAHAPQGSPALAPGGNPHQPEPVQLEAPRRPSQASQPQVDAGAAAAPAPAAATGVPQGDNAV